MNQDTPNIYQRMAAITAELQTVAKNLTVETSKNKGYKAVSERDIIDAVKPAEAYHGVYSYPASREILDSAMLESETEYQGKVTKRTTFFTRIKTVYRFVNMDDPKDYIETTTFAEGIDSQDKGSGKAMTYGDKYALMKAYKISTGDDPDQTASADERYTRKEAPERVEPQKADESLVQKVITGLRYVSQGETEEQRALLKELTGKTNVYDLSQTEATELVIRLRELARG